MCAFLHISEYFWINSTLRLHETRQCFGLCFACLVSFFFLVIRSDGCFRLFVIFIYSLGFPHKRFSRSLWHGCHVRLTKVLLSLIQMISLVALNARWAGKWVAGMPTRYFSSLVTVTAQNMMTLSSDSVSTQGPWLTGSSTLGSSSRDKEVGSRETREPGNLPLIQGLPCQQSSTALSPLHYPSRLESGEKNVDC